MTVLPLLILALLDAGGPARDTYAAIVDRYARCDAAAVNDLLNLGSDFSATALLPDSMATDGGLLSGRSARLSDVFSEIVREYRHRYRLTYYPSGAERHGWHQVTVACTKGKVARARRGYYGD